MPLLAKPLCDIALPAHEPRIDQDVVVYAGAMFDCVGRTGYLKEPGGIGIEVVEDWAARCKSANNGVADLQV